MAADLIITNARITTLDPTQPDAEALGIAEGRIVAVGSERDVGAQGVAGTKVLDAGGRRLIPGLIDSHLHLVRAGLSYNLELRWDGVPSLADAMRMLARQVQRTSAPQWVRVIGGFSELQFAERRLPTLQELNAIAPQTPVMILHLYDRALLNGAAIRALGYDREVPAFPEAQVERDPGGRPTGLLIAAPNAAILYGTIARLPRLSTEDQLNSTRLFMRELNRLGVTSAIDAGGGGQQFPEDYDVIRELHRRGEMTVRVAYNLFTQSPGVELADFEGWLASSRYGDGDEMFRLNGAGETLVYSAADFEKFSWARPDLPASMEDELECVIRLLAESRWPWRLHATYDESITRMLDVFERVNRDVPFDGLRWFFDHAETVSQPSLERIAALGGGIAVQNRMAYQGEAFIDRYGAASAATSPPIAEMLATGLPVGGGTDATRVSSYNPWVSLYWLIAGRTVGGTELYPTERRLSREEALRRWTVGSAWFSGEEGEKGVLAVGRVADLALLSGDLMTVPEEDIKGLHSVLTLVGGKVAHAAGPFTALAPELPKASPDWSPANLTDPRAAPLVAGPDHGHYAEHLAPGVGRGAHAFWDHATGLVCPCSYP